MTGNFTALHDQEALSVVAGEEGQDEVGTPKQLHHQRHRVPRQPLWEAENQQGGDQQVVHHEGTHHQVPNSS
eukprot:CAMPEP_0181514624 /NCGR_PEP_ID=MMETSP1110-20121109/63134_1 /TAXON_ID=174948 /ORGANISM="Symbiodinium sp., Strain CCMP421" /LENGTH=71 /DNA_ID=CAMNT_0023644575 /DNA_START=16 /DNA_END=228 /DNA_ORIENTATION=+